jgi:hypothetical protein
MQTRAAQASERRQLLAAQLARRNQNHLHRVSGGRQQGEPYSHWGWGRFLRTTCSKAPGAPGTTYTTGCSLAGHAGMPLQLPKAQQMEPNWLDRQASAPAAGGIGRI